MTVIEEEPITGLVATNDSPTILGVTTTFTTTITNGTNVTFAWDFGDGSTQMGQVVGHTYNEPGLYTAIVTAMNSRGSASAETEVTVEALRTKYYLTFIHK